MNRTARNLAALTVTAAASVAFASTASADVTTDPTATCTRNLVCAPVNAPIDAHNLRILTNVLTGDVLGGL